MIYALILAAAEEGGKQAPQQAQDPLGGLGFMLPFLFIMLLFWLMVMRPQARRQEMERRTLLESLKKNDKVLTHAGIYGNIVSVGENDDEVTLKIDDNVRIKVTKGSIARNLTAEETARQAKAAKDGAASGSAAEGSSTGIRKA
jgi:preprotein translocase subunit YajC